MTKDELTKILIEARNRKNLSQEQVAVLTPEKITRQYYGMIENGERRPSVGVAQSIAKILDIPWTLFFENEGNKKLLKIKKPVK
ncbi:helix-turn-helix transcriptional regulator [Bacillus badius]|uniref:helix-turn-helix transcriptional regulator n=1 Tax=Bacillus badius TaxID=1455 RepID=UPI002E211BBC|nr:helix-turn-helix transcriptional regulator [Bacillus badius]